MNKALIAIDKSHSFRVYLAITTAMVEDARKIHNTSPLATAALGRVLTGTGLMGLQLKNNQDKLTVQFKGDGPAGEILVTAGGNGRVKGYISNPDVDLPLSDRGKLDVGGAVGKGTLTVIKDLGLKEPYIGKIDLVSGEIGEDLTAYFFLSEQQSSSVALGVRINTDYTTLAAGGMIIQMLPDANPDSVDALEKLLNEMNPISSLIEETVKQSAGKTEEAIIDSLLARIFNTLPDEFAVERLEYREICWDCDCSVERLEQVVISIGSKDLTEIIEEDEKAELICQFCGTKYHFDKEHLETLLKESMQKEGKNNVEGF
ncbi:MAG: Hsp33 family molecular chaperone HslO [Eubacteriales bacterium]|nr:Hsp33 family molecular chaperone HslO [Eubacteriales bacterium]MDD3199320.1 Hsp33 family molecular chaperone HslO [Eubacteriales bacterium]MDD4475905.1 Hsp33 family molecular chaperone HslO [Eubacteriales bacterium]